MAPNTPQPSILRKTAGLAYDLLAFTALASAPAGAVYTYLAWQDAKTASDEAVKTARHAGDLVTLGESALEAKRDDLELQRGILAALNKILPEQERARIGIERLAKTNERRLAEVNAEKAERQRRKSVAKETSASAPENKQAPRSTEQTNVASSPNQVSEEILGGILSR